MVLTYGGKVSDTALENVNLVTT